jgi:hypothetical protein
VGIYKAEGFENISNSTAEQETLSRWIEIVKSSNSTVLEAPNIAAAKWTKNIWSVALSKQRVSLILLPKERIFWNGLHLTSIDPG